jgi:hypothetical protein
MKVEFSWQIFEKFSNFELYENPHTGSRVVPCGQMDGQTAMKKLVVTYHIFVNMPKCLLDVMVSGLVEGYTHFRATCCLHLLSTLMTELAEPFQIVVYFYKTLGCHIPNSNNSLHSHCHKNIKSYSKNVVVLAHLNDQ